VAVSGGDVTFTISFAPGTFDPQATWLFVEVDSDRNVSTGAPTNGLGMDYFVSMSGAPGTATVFRCPSRSASCPDAVGAPTVSLLTNGVAIAMPLSFLGAVSSDQARFDFRIYASSPGGGPTDYMPDLTLAPAHAP